MHITALLKGQRSRGATVDLETHVQYTLKGTGALLWSNTILGGQEQID